MKEMGKRLKGLRESMGLSQMKMAEILGLKQPSINRYEQGTATPTVENLRKYADYFDVSMDYIFARMIRRGNCMHISRRLWQGIGRCGSLLSCALTRVRHTMKG